jgi:hypothetical protein
MNMHVTADPRDAILHQVKMRWHDFIRGSETFDRMDDAERIILQVQFDDEIDHLLKTLHAKQHDYGDTWGIVERELSISPVLAAEILVATKWGRYKELRTGEVAQVDEKVDDTLIDLAGYAIILACLRRGINPATREPLAGAHGPRVFRVPIHSEDPEHAEPRFGFHEAMGKGRDGHR